MQTNQNLFEIINRDMICVQQQQKHREERKHLEILVKENEVENGNENVKFLENQENLNNNEEDDVHDDVHDDDDDDEQDDLTNLAWLTELRNQRHNGICYNGEFEYETTTTTLLNDKDHDLSLVTSTTVSTINTNDLPKILYKQQNMDNKHQQQQQKTTTIIKRPSPMERFETFCKKVKRDFAEYEKSAIEYQTMEGDKPPFNYSHIIGMVMLEKGRVTLQQICAWIELKFAYFRTRKKWNNSIRHNLSLHPCFRKIDRKKYEKGKGGYWELGIDLKKCERKRIRHRKSVQKQQKIQQQQQQQNEKDIEKNKWFEDNSVKDFELMEESINNDDDIVGGEYIKHHEEENDTEFFLDDEFDVQQNIDIISCCHKQDTFALQHQQQEQQQQQQEEPQSYQLGTIIISGGGGTGTSSTEAFLRATAVSSSSSYSSSSLSKTTSTTTNCTPFITNWQNYYQITDNDTATMTTKRANVIVEEIQQQQHNRPLLLATLLSPAPEIEKMASATENQFDENMATTTTITTTANNDFLQTTEIDSIEEAFQYLRSLDTNNRDDNFLDNFFDVSVSDF